MKIYAGWVEDDTNIYRTNYLDYTDFLPGTTTTYAYAYNTNNQDIQLEFQTSSIFDNSSHQEFNIEANGFIYLSAPDGFKITFFEIAQWKYNNISMFEDSSNDETYKLDIAHNDMNLNGQPFYLHSYDGEGVSEISAYNTYSGPIYLKYVRVILERI